jgi:hypothetical protein
MAPDPMEAREVEVDAQPQASFSCWSVVLNLLPDSPGGRLFADQGIRALECIHPLISCGEIAPAPKAQTHPWLLACGHFLGYNIHPCRCFMASELRIVELKGGGQFVTEQGVRTLVVDNEERIRFLPAGDTGTFTACGKRWSQILPTRAAS